MKQFVFFLLISLAANTALAQKSNYGEIRLAHPEVPDSLQRLDLSLENIQNEIDMRHASRLRNNYYGRDKSLDSLYTLQWRTNIQKKRLINEHHEELGIAMHLMNAGKYVRRGYTLELTGLAFSCVSGICLGSGFSNENDGMKVVGYIAGAAALGNIIGAYVCHFKSGRELKLAGNSITYSF